MPAPKETNRLMSGAKRHYSAGEVARGHDEDEFFIRRAREEITLLMTRLLYGPPLKLEITPHGVVRDVVFPKDYFRTTLEEHIPHGSDTPRDPDTNRIINVMYDATQNILMRCMSKFKMLPSSEAPPPSDGDLQQVDAQPPSEGDLLVEIEDYLKNLRKSDSIAVGRYFERSLPQRNLASKRLQANALLESLADLIRETPELKPDIAQHPRFKEVFETAAEKPADLLIPTEAPELWDKRKDASGETSLGFLRRVYGRWLPAPLTISILNTLDPPLYLTLKQWTGRNKPPADLRLFFRGQRKRKTTDEVDAELKKFNIRKPEDAYARFPKDKSKANRLYMAAMRRI